MGRGRVGAVVAITSLVLAGSAFAGGKTQLSGTVDEDSLATVNLTVASAGGLPKSVKNVRIKNLLAQCGSSEARIELNLSGAAKLDEKRKFDMTYQNDDGKVELKGKVKADSSKVKAEITGSTIQIAGAGTCKVPNVSITAKS
jgi:hypothetical protein